MERLTLALLVALFTTGCAGGRNVGTGGGSLERTAWRLADSPDGRSLELLAFSGHSSCLTYDHVETDETGASVEVRAYVRYNDDEACTDDFVTERVQVRLNEVAGDRKLEGCSGPAVEWNGFEETSGDCREVHES